MHILLEENWTCSQQVGKLTLTGKKSRGFPSEMGTRYEGRSGIHATASGCSGRVGVLEGAPSSGSTTAVSLKVDSMGNGSSSDSSQVLPIHVPEASLSRQDEHQAETDENEVQISIAPPEKWADPDFMEDGEISGFEESDSDVVVTELPRWQQNSERDKRSYEEDQKLPNLKRQRLDKNVGESTRRQSSSPAKVSKSRIDYILGKSGSGPEQCSFKFSRLSEPNVSNHQQGLDGQDSSPQYTLSTDTSLDDLIASSLESESSQGDSFEDQFSLVPLLRSIIEAQRKKTAELESENNLLKSLFAKSLSEKNETLEMLRKSNQTLKKVTNSSVVMADEVKALKTQLAEKDAEIKNLRKDSFTIRDCVSRMSRTFLKIQEIENQAAGRGSGEEDPRTGDSQKQDSNKVRVNILSLVFENYYRMHCRK